MEEALKKKIVFKILKIKIVKMGGAQEKICLIKDGIIFTNKNIYI